MLDSAAPKPPHYNGNSNNLSTDAVLSLYLIGHPKLVEIVKMGEFNYHL